MNMFKDMDDAALLASATGISRLTAENIIRESGDIEGLVMRITSRLPISKPARDATTRRMHAMIELSSRINRRKPLPVLSEPIHVFNAMRDKIGSLKHEEFWVLALTVKNELIYCYRASQGTVNESLVHPREVFRPAIQVAAAAVIVCHNHPSGSVDPSGPDIDTTERMINAGHIIGIPLLDHVIVTFSGFTSLREASSLDFGKTRCSWT